LIDALGAHSEFWEWFFARMPEAQTANRYGMASISNRAIVAGII
jgi:hypothetical protein